MKELEITLQHLESAVVLHAAGPVDSNTAEQLQEPLLRAAEGPTGAVELDLAEVSYMSSAGLGFSAGCKGIAKTRRAPETCKRPTSYL